LHTGNRVEIIVTKNKEAIIRPIFKKVDDVFCRLHQPNRKAISVEDMDDAIIILKALSYVRNRRDNSI
jgi:antitoxin PrlF